MKVTLMVSIFLFSFRNVILEAIRQERQPGEPNARTPCPGAITGSDWGFWKLTEAR